MHALRALVSRTLRFFRLKITKCSGATDVLNLQIKKGVSIAKPLP